MTYIIWKKNQQVGVNNSSIKNCLKLICLEKEMTTHSSVLAWRIPGTGEPGGLPSTGSHKVGHDWSDLASKQARNRQASLVAQLVKICLQGGRPEFDPWVGKIPWRKERLPTPVFWVRHDWATFIYLLVCIKHIFDLRYFQPTMGLSASNPIVSWGKSVYKRGIIFYVCGRILPTYNKTASNFNFHFIIETTYRDFGPCCGCCCC